MSTTADDPQEMTQPPPMSSCVTPDHLREGDPHVHRRHDAGSGDNGFECIVAEDVCATRAWYWLERPCRQLWFSEPSWP